MGNDAIADNPPSYPIDITTRGSSFLWAIFALFAVSALGMIFLALRASPGKRIFHWLSVAILTVATINYFSMASNLGKTSVLVAFYRERGNLYNGPAETAFRAIWYSRYIQWTITAPLLVLLLVLATGLPLGEIFIAVFFSIVAVVNGLLGALTRSRYKFGFFAFGVVALLVVIYILLLPGRKAARALGIDFGSIYFKSAAFLSFIWLFYPISWGLSEGGNVIPPDSEMIFYAVLDVLSMIVLTYLHVMSLRRVEYERLELQSGKHSVGAHIRGDVPFQQIGKGHTFGDTGNGTTNGTGNGLTGRHQNGTTVDPTDNRPVVGTHPVGR